MVKTAWLARIRDTPKRSANYRWQICISAADV